MGDSNGPPRLTIGLPIFNGERYLPRTLDSLLQQTFGDFQLIVSDNASTDSTEAICRDYASRDSRIQYHRSPTNRGAAWNFNNTFHLARSDYFKWAAHDDLYLPTFLERCVEALERDPSVILSLARTEFIDSRGKKLGEYDFPVDLSTASPRDVFRLYTMAGHINCEIFGVFRTAALRETPLIGSYVGSDLVLMGRLALRGRFHQVPEKLFLHREHPERSTQATGGAGGYTQWFDPSKSGRFAMPFWRRLLENSRSVARAPLTAREKLDCLWDVCRTANWNRRALLDDILSVISPGAGTRP